MRKYAIKRHVSYDNVYVDINVHSRNRVQLATTIFAVMIDRREAAWALRQARKNPTVTITRKVYN